jgi:hypothetical protein
LTFSRQGESQAINTICKTDNFTVSNLMKCITNDLVKMFARYNMKVKEMNLFQYYRTFTITFYIFYLKQVETSIFNENYFKKINDNIKIQKLSEVDSEIKISDLI